MSVLLSKNFRIVLAIGLLFAFWGCNQSQVDDSEPTRPTGIPENALWVGGIDGGVYVVVRKLQSDPPHIYDAEIYHTVGEIDYQGKLTIDASDKAKFDLENKAPYSVWDGDTLYLRDGRQLKILSK